MRDRPEHVPLTFLWYRIQATAKAKQKQKQTQIKAEAKARALRKVEELTNQLEIAKLNYRQFGGELKEDVYKREMEENKVRVTAELDAQLEYERERREKLESKIDVLRSQVHNFTKQLKESANKNMHGAAATATFTPLTKMSFIL